MSNPIGQSWGRYPKVSHQQILALHSRHDRPQFDQAKTYLAHGLGRSYGDCALNDGGVLLSTRGMNRILGFDTHTGVLDCESGVSLERIIDAVLPQGWFPAVVPGTQFVTVGGAIANDIHGKNHHRAGTFGCHVLDFDLLRSDGKMLRCSPHKNAELFAATVGGLGLTGLILRARLQLRQVPGPWLQTEQLRFESLDEFLQLSSESEVGHEYTVAWVDSLCPHGRGLFLRGNHVATERPPPKQARSRSVPFTPPISLINKFSVRAFNACYFHLQAGKPAQRLTHYRPFFFPLDSLLHWNRIYGPAGFLQYQCVVPMQYAQAIAEMLREIAKSGLGSSLSVLKTFGAHPSPGLLSFPRKGITLALDFTNDSAQTFHLLDRLDKITEAASGSIYLAKDARMSSAMAVKYHPVYLSKFSEIRDPRFSSSMTRRLQWT